MALTAKFVFEERQQCQSSEAAELRWDISCTMPSQHNNTDQGNESIHKHVLPPRLPLSLFCAYSDVAFVRGTFHIALVVVSRSRAFDGGHSFIPDGPTIGTGEIAT